MAPATPHKRPGRKPMPPELKRVQRTVVIAPEVDKWLEGLTRRGESLGMTIDRIARDAGCPRPDY